MRYKSASLIVLACALTGQAHAKPQGLEASITRTTYGIPHITAKNWKGIGYGVGYAYAQDNLCMLAEDFATVADWELAGGWTTVKGQRVKDEGVLEKFDVSLEEAQTLIMTARVMLGWVDPTEMEAPEEEQEAEV
jgi:hypothetical protein